ncbi:periplasmic heavy metal sensor [Granulicella arctica]|uniref:periplasmic heavy metal sensor n=1 Tax=Granulicella arctica TaxID=940613 RepID=UPI003D7C2ACE
MPPSLLLVTSLLLSTPLAYAQNAAGPAPVPNSQSTPVAPPSPMHGRGMKHDIGPGRGIDHGEMRRPGDDLLPPGTWWRSPEVTARIGLTVDQQKRIEDLFLQSRMQLIHTHASLEEEQLLLEPLLNANPVDQGKALAQIDKIADTRADLEKANAKMLLSIRGVLNADQWTKLQALHRGIHDTEGFRGERRGSMDRGFSPQGGRQGPAPASQQ